MRTPLAKLRFGDRWLAAFAIVCVLTSAAELLWPHPLQTREATAAPAAPSALPPVVPQPDSADYRIVAEHPLFTTDRRPFVPPAPPVVAAPPEAPRVRFELSAIVTGTVARVALLKTSTSPAIKKVGLNETIEGWTLEDVRADSVVLRQGAEVQVVELKSNEHKARDGITGASLVREH